LRRKYNEARKAVGDAFDTVPGVAGEVVQGGAEAFGGVDRVASATAALAANVRIQAARAQHRIASSARAGGRRLVSGARTAARAAAAPVRACMSSGACRTAVVAAAVVATAVVCSVCAAGMLMGGAFGTAAGVATCGGDWGCVGRSGLAGAAGGALAPRGAGLGGAILGGALSSAGSGAAGQFMAGRFDAGALRRDALVGAGTGAAFHALGGLRGSLRGRGGAEPNTAVDDLVPDDFIVVRGGTSDVPPVGEIFSGAAGHTLDDAAAGVPHGQIRTTTAGRIRAGGGMVEHAPELTRGGVLNERHVNICLGSGPCPFGPLQPNPVPKSGRIQ
jgi:hypothetical protein